MLWKDIRDAVSQGRVHALQFPPRETVDGKPYDELMLTDEVGTMADWGLYERAGLRLAPDDSELSPDTIDSQYADVISGEIRWDALRDQLHETVLENGSKALAGQQIGMLRRFVSEAQTGDIIIGNFSQGLIPGRITGPAIYDLSSHYFEETGSQAIYRQIEWATIDGDWVILSNDAAPTGFGRSRRTFITLSTPGNMVEIMRFGEWIGTQL